MSWRLVNPDVFELWHDRLVTHWAFGATMVCKIIKNMRRHFLKNTKILLSKDYSCKFCLKEKLIIKPSMTKVDYEPISFLQRIQMGLIK